MRKIIFILKTPVRLNLKQNRLVINEEISIPFGAFDAICIVANGSLTLPLIKKLLSRNKIIVFSNSYFNVYGQFIPNNIQSFSLKIRKYQYVNMEKEEEKSSLCYLLLRDKFELSKELFPEIAEIEVNYFNLLLSKNFLQADALLMKNLYKNLRKYFDFSKREYNPPSDKINAILSFLYTSLYALSIKLCIVNNLDPYVGFFHIRRGEHATLASDLMEILRPFVIKFLINNKQSVDNIGYINNKLDPETLSKVYELFLEEIIDKRKYEYIQNFIIKNFYNRIYKNYE